MINVISLGGGKQSTYMLLNALDGNYSYKPDCAIFADTGCEPKYVYTYFKWLKSFVKKKYDFDIFIVSGGDLVNDINNYLSGKTKRASQIPLRLEGDGLLIRGCTETYKILPIRRKLQEIRKKRKVKLWIGISLDEIQRIKSSSVQYIKNEYPLIENRISIDNIVEWYKKTGIPEPMKSACLICPFHSNNYWRRIKKVFLDEFEEACLFDDGIRNYPKLNKKAYLHKYLKPLRNIDFTYELSIFPELIEDCEGLCGL